MDFVWLAGLILYAFNILTIIGLVFSERRSYDSLLIWVLILIMLPIIGLFFYMLFGKGPSIGKKKKFLQKIESDEAYLRRIESQKKVLATKNSLEDDLTSLAYFNLSQSGSIITGNNNVEILRDTEAMYKRMFEDIEKAKKYVNVLFFIIKNDEYGKKLRDVLVKKAQEGVKVRLIYDHVGSFKLRRAFFKELRAAGGTAIAFLPSIFRLFFRNVNYRNHRKIVVVDGKIAYTGSANVGREYVSLHKRCKPWHDTQIRVTGDAVTLINFRFMQDFNFTTTPEPVQFARQLDAGRDLVQLLSSGPDTLDEQIKISYIKAIYGAHKRVYIQTPYFIPDQSFLTALITAAQSGVDVRVMIPKIPDKRYVYLCTTYYMKQLLPYGIKFYLWKGFMHSKTLLVDDDISSIGTFNIDTRSFKLHFEMTTFIYGTQFGMRMLENFEHDMSNSQEVPKDYKSNIFRSLLENFMRLFTPLM